MNKSHRNQSLKSVQVSKLTSIILVLYTSSSSPLDDITRGGWLYWLLCTYHIFWSHWSPATCRLALVSPFQKISEFRPMSPLRIFRYLPVSYYQYKGVYTSHVNSRVFDDSGQLLRLSANLCYNWQATFSVHETVRQSDSADMTDCGGDRSSIGGALKRNQRKHSNRQNITKQPYDIYNTQRSP